MTDKFKDGAKSQSGEKSDPGSTRGKEVPVEKTFSQDADRHQKTRHPQKGE